MGSGSSCRRLLRRRIRQPQFPGRSLDPCPLPALLLLVLLLLPSPVRAESNAVWSVDASIGHDDQLLADPEQLGIVRAVSDRFLSGASRFLFRWDDRWRENRIELVAEARGTTYGAKVEGGDGQLRLVGSGRRRLGDSWVVDLVGASTRFRRDEGASPEPVFNYNLFRLDGRVGWSLSPDWLLSLDLQRSWLDFPGRFVSPDTLDFETESQRHWSASAAAVWKVGDSGFVTGEVAYRSARSNLEAAEYEGPILSFRARSRLSHKLWLSSYVSLSHRAYDRFTTVDSLDQRSDETWQIGLTLERPLGPRIRMFLDGTFLHQVSNFDEFDFDQSRVGLGVTLDLLVTEPHRALPVQESPYTPTPVPEGIRFRYPDTGAGTVALVGGFNDWNPEAAPLERVPGRGFWEIVVPVPPGRWRYAFVVDGEWVAPPGAVRTESDGFGGINGILEVQSREPDPVTQAPKSRPKR